MKGSDVQCADCNGCEVLICSACGREPVAAHPPGKFEFAFPHTKGEPWWLTDGYGYSREVSPPVWLYYRIGRKRRTERFNRRLQAGVRP